MLQTLPSGQILYYMRLTLINKKIGILLIVLIVVFIITYLFYELIII